MLIDDVKVLAQALVHASECLTHLHHLLLNIFGILLCLLFVSLLEYVLPVLCQLVVTNFFKISNLNVVREFFHWVDFVVKAVKELVLHVLRFQFFMEIVLAFVAVSAGAR